MRKIDPCKDLRILQDLDKVKDLGHLARISLENDLFSLGEIDGIELHAGRKES